MGFFSQVVSATTTLVTAKAGIFLSIGFSEFRIIAVILFIIEGAKVALGHQPANRLAHMLMSIAIIYTGLTYYQNPIPGAGRSFPQVVSDIGLSLSDNLDETMNEQIGTAVSNVLGNVSGSAWNIVLNTASAVRYFLIVLALSAMQAAVLAIIAFGFVAVGVLILIGPVFLPLALVPGLDWLARGWLRSIIQYSLFPLIANAVVYVFTTVWIGYLQQFQGPMDASIAIGLVFQLIVLSIAGIFGILKIPQLVAGICSGSSGMSAMPSIGWWR